VVESLVALPAERLLAAFERYDIATIFPNPQISSITQIHVKWSLQPGSHLISASGAVHL